MTSRWWSKFVLSSVFVLALATGDSARAQFGFEPYPVFPSVGQFGLGYGVGGPYGTTAPFDFGAFGYGGVPGFGTFPIPGYGLSTGQWPQTITAYPSAFDAVTLIPAWSGRPRHVRRRR
jgi:hypothetical protein